MQRHDLIPVSYREPFAFGRQPWRDVRQHGQTVLEIVRSVPDLPPLFAERGIVCINGEPVPRELWSFVRPKANSEFLPIAMTLHYPAGNPGGGRGSGTKSIVALVAAIALVAVASFITGGGAAVYLGYGAAGLFGPGTLSAYALAGAVTVAGSLAIAALTKPPTQDSATSSDSNTDNKDAAAASGNVISPGGSVPRVIGIREIFPPIVAPPFVEQIDDINEKVSVVFGLNGPHDISSVFVDGVDVTGVTDLTTELKPGESSDTALTSVTRQGKINAPNIQLSQHILDATNTKLATANTTTEIPQWHRFVTNDSPDEVFIQLLLPGGVGNNSGGVNTAFPFRMRCRILGTSTWINFPEFHLFGVAIRQTRRQIRLRWGITDVGTQPIPASGSGWFYLHRAPPPQTIAPATPTAWVADSHFDVGSGHDYSFNGQEIGTRIKNYNVSSPWCLDFLMTGLTQGIYEIEIMRGCAYYTSNFAPTTYVSGGTGVLDFFWVSGTSPNYLPVTTQSDKTSVCNLVRCVSVWNSHPIATAQGKFALIALTALNRSIQRVSCVAGGRAGSWNGSDWTSVYGPTSNPAAHYRSVLLGAQNHDPLDSSLVDDAKLQAWFNYCASPPSGHAWKCDAIVDDMRTQDVLDLIASCGYGRPYQSDIYGVALDIDRSLDSPVQVFSRINTANMQYSKAFAKAPAGLIVSYHNRLNTIDATDQVIVNQSDPSVGTTGLYESVNYDGLIDTAAVTARAKFDLDQANLRNIFYTFDCDMESLVCRRGDLVAIQHDSITIRAGDAHVKTVTRSSGNITGFVLDSIIPCVSGTGIAIRRKDGTITTHAITNVADTDTITLTTPFSDPGVNVIAGYDDSSDEYGCLVVSGDLATVYKRMLVHTISTSKDLRANVTLVDEAPALVRY